VLDTRVLVQKVGQGSSVGLLLGKVVDGHFGSLPGNCDYKIRKSDIKSWRQRHGYDGNDDCWTSEKEYFQAAY
jgi:hypothetical protein